MCPYMVYKCLANEDTFVCGHHERGLTFIVYSVYLHCTFIINFRCIHIAYRHCMLYVVLSCLVLLSFYILVLLSDPVFIRICYDVISVCYG